MFIWKYINNQTTMHVWLYTPPRCKSIGGPLLDNVYKHPMPDMKGSLNSKIAMLAQDRWSNIHNEPAAASYLQVNNMSYRFDSHDAGCITKSAENYKAMLHESIQTQRISSNGL